MKEFLRGFMSALRLLTIVPVPGKESREQSSALYWFPVVGCLIGGLQYGIVYLLATYSADWPEGIAVIVLAFGVILTGGLHIDGLADWADSLGCVWDREKMLEIMKDSRTGTFGVIAIIIVLLGKWCAVSRLAASGHPLAIIGAAILSRTMMVDLAVRYPYARPDGGTGRNIITTAGYRHLILAYTICFSLVYLFAGLEGIVWLTGCLMVTHCLGRWSKRKLGGITGDVLGACSELSEVTVLLLAAFFMK